MQDSAGGGSWRRPETCRSEILPGCKKLKDKDDDKERELQAVERSFVLTPGGSLTVPREAAGAAALERALLRVALQQLRPSALRLLQIDEDAREAPDPAVLVVGGGRAAGLGEARRHTQHRQQGRPGAAHGARLKSEHFKKSSRTDMSGVGWRGSQDRLTTEPLVPFDWCH